MNILTIKTDNPQAEVGLYNDSKKIDQIVKTNPKVYVLNEYEQEQIRISQKQYENGEFINGKEMNSLVKEWAKKQ